MFNCGIRVEKNLYNQPKYGLSGEKTIS